MTLWIRLYYYTYIHTSTNRLCYSTALSSSAHLLVVPVLRSCQSPIWIWLVNYLHLHYIYIALLYACI